MNDSMNKVECHPWEPFLPDGARLLMLGSFPPGRHRWSMEFFYPNPQNDMWRIVGWLAYGDKEHFALPEKRAFDRAKVERFCKEIGIALYDTAAEVIRLKNNASDSALQVMREVDIKALLRAIPACCDVVTTGGKATEILCRQFEVEAPPVGEFVETLFEGRSVRLWRMPSSSRAYPRPIEWKAEFYRKVLLASKIIG